MIYAEIKDLERYRGLGAGLDRAIGYLLGNPLDGLEPGRYEIDGNRVYMNVFDYETIEEEGAFFEAHKKYADIHMVVAGRELVGGSDLSRLTVKRFDKEADLMEVEGPVEHYIQLIPGKALVTLPEDAHKVKLAAGMPAPVRKAVIKVYMEHITEYAGL